MAKKISYNKTSREELILELVKGREAVRTATIDKRKSGKAKEYRAARKTVARILTAMNHGQNNVSSVVNVPAK